MDVKLVNSMNILALWLLIILSLDHLQGPLRFNETVMGNPNASALILSAEPSEQSEKQKASSSANSSQPSLQLNQNFSHGPVVILWDIENCPVPSDVHPEDVAGNIRMALLVHPIIKGAVTMFSAYGDFNAFPRRLREGCQRTGVKLKDVPNGRKDAADKAILVDMFLFALDNLPPSSIMLISGDVDFAPALHILGQRGYTVILVIPLGLGVSSALSNAVSGGPVVSCDQDDLRWIQPGDLNGLKGQLVKLLELSGGCLPLSRVPADYQKVYGRPLYISEYGALKLVNLLKKMVDAMTIEGKGNRKIVYLRNSRPSPSAPPLVLAKKDRKGKGTQEEYIDITTGGRSSDEFSDDERVVVDDQDERRNGGKTDLGITAQSEISDQSLEEFKYELQEILVSYSCRIFLGFFDAIYQQRYKKPLDYRRFGVNELEELLEKVRDVVVLQEEPVNKRKFLAAVGG
ncbi:unnamed protein product [Ilex paraguariensis]|uniref:HTH OST-type domain-containing protein n=1 Tax=Ilex paraguariensis TaxID=185542 RepID=A0ABC8UJK3_9AQUA